MKINTKLIILLSTICLVIISNVRSYSERERVYQDVEIKPRVAHIQNNFEHVVKPLVERPFLPEEVEKLSDLKKRKVFYDEQMNTATIVGSPNAPAGRVEVNINKFILILFIINFIIIFTLKKIIIYKLFRILQFILQFTKIIKLVLFTQSNKMFPFHYPTET
jgi:hypothetical protein